MREIPRTCHFDDRRNLNQLSSFHFHLSTLTTPSNRNPQGVTMPRDLRPVAAGVVEVARATFIFALFRPLHSTYRRSHCRVKIKGSSRFPFVLLAPQISPLTRLFNRAPRGMNFIHPSRDQSLKGSRCIDSPFLSRPTRDEFYPSFARLIAKRLAMVKFIYPINFPIHGRCPCRAGYLRQRCLQSVHHHPSSMSLRASALLQRLPLP